jgi:Ala-tRNA(Pro) deacylase
MPLPKKIINFLEKNKIKYKIIEHKKVFTAYDKAQTLKVPPRVVGKSLVVRWGKEAAIVLIAANKNLDKVKLKKTVNKKLKKEGKKIIKNISFVTETWMKNNLKGVKIGAIPPFGSLWKLPTFVDKSLLRQRKIIVNSGDNNFSVQLSTSEFKKKIPEMIVASFSKVKKL